MTSKKVLVSGGAGFIGRHLVRRLISDGHSVLVADNFYSSRRSDWDAFQKRQGSILFLHHDVRQALPVSVLSEFRPQEVYHLACPASPKIYSKDPLMTLETSVLGVRNFLEAARQFNARFLFTSTSEVYGDPEVHPQPESYRGAVNTWGPRACYDEGKRVGETLCYLYSQIYSFPIRVARIFNTYGPGMAPHDGRILTEFIAAARERRPYPIFGDGSQTRSFCFVDDLVEGLIRLMDSSLEGPVNLGNPQEVSVLDVAHRVHDQIGHGKFEAEWKPLPQDDPKVRRPAIDRAQKYLQWEPSVSLDEGIRRMIAANP